MLLIHARNIEELISQKRHRHSQKDIDHRMLLKEHCGKNDQCGNDKRDDLDRFLIAKLFACGDRYMDRQRIENMDAWQDIGRCISAVQFFYHVGEYIIAREHSRSELLCVWIQIRHDKEYGHAGHHMKDHAVVFTMITLAEYEIKNRKQYVKEPEKVRDDENLTEGDHIIECGVDNVIKRNFALFKVVKYTHIQQCIGEHYDTVFTIAKAPFKKQFQQRHLLYLSGMIIVNCRFSRCTDIEDRMPPDSPSMWTARGLEVRMSAVLHCRM